MDATTDDDIARQIAEDRDTAPELDDASWAAAVAPRDRKQAISLRVDGDVLAWFRKRGAGYQSRMNDVLRVYMEHQQRRDRVRGVTTTRYRCAGGTCDGVTVDVGELDLGATVRVDDPTVAGRQHVYHVAAEPIGDTPGRLEPGAPPVPRRQARRSRGPR